jgi:sortase A
MPDKRIVDELSIEELERVLALKKRQARQEQMERMHRSGRVVPRQTPVVVDAPPLERPPTTALPQFEDAVEPHAFKRKNEDSQLWRRFVDRSLLLVELAAVVGLVVLGLNFLQGIGKLEQETQRAQEIAATQLNASIPTIEPTPTMRLENIVLPGGHTPPNADGTGGFFNFNEIPISLRGLVRDQIFLPPELTRPPITAETAVRIIIPDINVDSPIVQGVDWEALTQGVGQVQNGVTPDGTGNLGLAAHNDIYGEIFRDLDKLQPGMLFEVHTQKQIYTYVVTGYEIVAPADVRVLQNRGGATVTLISCYPYRVNTQRYIIFAEQLDS